VQAGYYIDVTLKKDAIARYGINNSDVQDILETAIGGQNLGIVIEGRMRFPIRLRYERDYRDNIDDLKSLIIPVSASAMPSAGMNSGMTSNYQSPKAASMNSMNSGNNNQNQAVGSNIAGTNLNSIDQNSKLFLPLSDLADITVQTGPPMISRRKRDVALNCFYEYPWSGYG